MKSNKKLAEPFHRFFFLQLSIVACLFTWVITNATAADNVSFDKKQIPSAQKNPVANKELCKSITDNQGKKYTHAKMGEITYKIPYEYIGGGTCSSGDVYLGIRWPSLRGFKTIAPGSGDVDAYRVILMPPKVPPAVDRYVSLNQLKFDEQKIPSKYPGLSFLQINGKQWSILVSGEQWPKTPSGNPYVFSVAPPYKSLDTTFVIPGGPTVRINDSSIHKYMHEWDRLFPAFIDLIKSFEQKG